MQCIAIADYKEQKTKKERYIIKANFKDKESVNK